MLNFWTHILWLPTKIYNMEKLLFMLEYKLDFVDFGRMWLKTDSWFDP